MAAGLALSKADVTADGAEQKGVSVLVRRGTATARKGRDIVVTREGVQTVTPLSRKSWRVTFDDGATWDVTKIGCVPCSGRR